MHRAFDPLYYVLLFPYGDDGWRDHLQKAPMHTIASDAVWSARVEQELRRHGQRNRITPTAFYAHRLHWRRGDAYVGNRAMLMGGRLLQEYCCTAWARAELFRLRYLRHNQQDMRVESYNNLRAERSQADEEGRRMHTCGKPVVLNSSFVGGPRDVAQRYQDALAIVRETRKPSVLLTMTANPKWPEIQASLAFGQKADDRPDIVSRVFKMKLDETIRDLKERDIFGRSVGILKVVEFQYRGLPHAHILLILDAESATLDVDRIDNVVCAEIPQITITEEVIDAAVDVDERNRLQQIRLQQIRLRRAVSQSSRGCL